MANPFCHIELTTGDPERARAFYGALFSWTLEVMPMGGGAYTMIQTGEGPGGGIMGKPMPEAPTMWMPYVQVGDLDASIAKVGELGGCILVPKTPIPGMGNFAVLQDPTGGVLGIWQG